MRQIRRRGRIVRTATAFAVGATAGSVLALLFAPASGRVTRRRLAMRVRNLQRTALRRIGQTQRTLATRADQVREAATEWIAEHVPHTNGRHAIRSRRVHHASAH